MKKIFVLVISMLVTVEVIFANTVLRNTGDPCSATLAKDKEVLQETHLLFRDGKVYKVENSESKVLQKELQLNNGTVVHPDGAYELKDKKRYVLSDGECLDMNGSHYLNQRMLNQKRPMSADELQRSRNQNTEKGSKDKQ
ncbi:DUF6799 domain-containing protein [Desertivirga brevis]|uniref:DUF6799 domain-containing protein n=1 Tax=Desertivirga brevis TaxID=2810310 RepID=UPI001A97702B|nr:DUF6799 domain-containing protein [Pedobacter sp. SYSU D00873]